MTSVELAQAALSCEPLARALELAEWVGDGRELTSTGVLRPAAAVQACAAIGIEPPARRPRSARDVEELARAWDVAVAAGFVLTSGGRAAAAGDVGALARAARGSATLPDDLAERTLLAWVRGAAVPMGFPAGPCPLCLTVLHELDRAAAPVETGELVTAVRQAIAPNVPGVAAGAGATAPDSGCRCPDCGQPHELPPGLTGPGGILGGPEEAEDLIEQDAAEHVATAAGLLVYFDAAFTGPGRTAGGTVTLTPLGKTLASSVFMSLAPDPSASAAEVVSRVAELPSPLAASLAAAWAGARTPAGAVRELLEYAERAEPGPRFAALRLARGQGPAAAPAWRELAGRPGFGAYARQWLAAIGEPAAEDDRDQAWLLADAMTEVPGNAPPAVIPFVLATAIREMDGVDAATVLEGLRRSGHPEGPALADAASRFLSLAGGAGRDGAGPDDRDLGLPGTGDLADDDEYDYFGEDLPEGAVLQLKITLRGVSRPPVWRRVLVPAGLPLGGLHEVIVRAMGWDGAHLHTFSDGITEWGMADGDLGIEDEDAIDAGMVLSVPGERMRYLYDFGDGWEHDITLENVLLPGEGAPGAEQALPACLAGKGACPPEDCGGPGGYAELKAVLADPRHEDHAAMLEWLGLSRGTDFDPGRFSLREVNERLRRAGIAAV
jgi:hypothetical protein